MPPQPTPKRPMSEMTQQDRRKAATRRNWSKVEEYLTRIEKVRGFDKAWELRERLERGEITLEELSG